ncbi:flagellar biosynthesis anti-sigma factor FlgM [Helicobacter cappadocius]|uniref:Flagellar biosynthesis anti-sigma factor FlgM n=1 Tax=Helicobacter cappadocius TaxID=3063998 RepID=A0AA90TBS7_9HELI|nr:MULTISPECIES: flagellar biosynthesis anti-sigma factor FlgM [unclassified Helicobacter]MDO7252919.1 flagellar biosynthesis anti-sigma factor FlgM [Helicobacter sp. faydin-H75]MDP2539091.1 flagellar biosynthesis anti-sigma factor FlgM [Helicobacter sp. faydin-H76]
MIKPVTVGTSPLIANENKKYSENIKPKNTQEVEDKAIQIKESVKNGTYRVDIQKTSEKMALNLLNL